jgi:MFS family permease
MTQTVSAADEQSAGRTGAGVFWRFWTASTVSTVGDAVTTVALPLLAVAVLHASTFEVSLLTAAQYLAWLLIGLPAGVIVQHLPLRGTQVAMDLVRAAAMLSLPAAAFLGVLTLPHLLVVALVVGMASVVYFVGASTFLPAIVSKEELTARNSLTSGSHAATNLGGPSLGGVLVQAVGAAGALVFDVVSYLLSAALTATLPQPRREPPADGGTPVLAQIRAGLRFVARHEVMRPCVIGATLVNTVNGALLALVPVYLVRTLDVSPALIGVLIATDGLGSLVGAALTTRLAARFGSARTLLAASAACPAALLLLPLAWPGAGLSVFALGYGGFGCGVVIFSVLTRTHRQTATPPGLLARVMATVRFVSWGVIPLGAVAAGLVATWLGTREALWAVGVFAFAAPLVLWAGPVRRRRELA